jgi:hypothetical protein
MKWTPRLMLSALSLFMTSPAFGRQAHVSRYDAFAGYRSSTVPMSASLKMVSTSRSHAAFVGEQIHCGCRSIPSALRFSTVAMLKIMTKNGG